MSSIFPVTANNETSSTTVVEFMSPAEFFKFIAIQASVLGVNLLWSTIIFIVGWILIKIFIWILRKILQRKRFDQTVISFIIAVASASLKILLVLICIHLLGLPMFNIGTIMAAIVISVGLALSGLLQNFVAGFYLLIARPISLGDYVLVVDNTEGTVLQIGVVNTVIRTVDYKHVIVPNSSLATNCIINYDKEQIRRVDRVFNIPITEDVNFVRKVILRLLRKHQKVLNDPAPRVRFKEFGNNHVGVSARAFVKKDDYWEMWFELPELIKIEFERCGIHMQIPQVEVKLHNEDQYYERPPMDEDYRKELEEAIIIENTNIENKKNQPNWKNILPKIKGNEELWGWRWKKKAKEVDLEKGEVELEKQKRKSL